MYTKMDAYPLPKVDEIVNNIAQYKDVSTIEFCYAYQILCLKQIIFKQHFNVMKDLISLNALLCNEWSTLLPEEDELIY